MDPDFIACGQTLAPYISNTLLDSCVRPVVDPVTVSQSTYSLVLPAGAARVEMEGAEHVVFVSGGLLSSDCFVSHDTGSDRLDYPALVRAVRHSRSDFSGVFCLLSAGPSSLEIFTDETGQFPLFSYMQGNDWVIATDPWPIVELLRRKGIEVPRDTKAVAMAMIYGTTFGTSTGFENINMVRGNYVSLDGNGMIRANSDSYISELFTEISYKEYLRETAIVLKQNMGMAVQALKSSAYNCVCDLTGGVDSRLTASLLISSGHDKDVGMFSLGKRPAPDRIVSDYLIEKYGWNPGLLIRPGETQVEHYRDVFRGAMFRAFGTKLSEFPDLARTHVGNMVRITGYYGEFSRVVYDKQLGFGDERIIRSFVRGTAARNSFLKDRVVTEFGEQLRRALRRYDDCGLEGKEKLQALYMENRSKVHFGIATHSADRSRFGLHPLNSGRLIRLAGALGDKECAMNRVCFDLICELAGRSFAVEPMAQKFWHKSLVKHCVSDDQREKSTITYKSDLNSGDSGAKIIALGGGQASPKRVDPAFTKKMRDEGRPYFWGVLPDALEVIEEAISELSGDSEIFSVLDKHKIQNLLKQGKDACDSGVAAKNIMRLAAMLVWINGNELECRIVDSEDANKLEWRK